MNKAFVREPDLEGRVYCPRCGNLGSPVGAGPLDTHILPDARGRMQDGAWFCSFGRCPVAYFTTLDAVVTIDELKGPIFPKDLDAPLCVCTGVTYDEIVAESDAPVPLRLRELIAYSKTDEAQCRTLAPDGKSCCTAVQELFMRLRGRQSL